MDGIESSTAELLHDELWWLIFSHLDCRETLAVAATCRGRLRSLARDEVVWAQLYAARFATPSGLQCDETLGTSLEKFGQRLRHPKPGDCASSGVRCSRETCVLLRARRGIRPRGRVGRELRARARQGLHGPLLVVLRRARGRRVHGPLPGVARRARSVVVVAGRPRTRRFFRWDEVVDRSCLRWPVSEGTRSPLRRGDVVEVYCRGARPASAPLPGASSRPPRRDL